MTAPTGFLSGVIEGFYGRPWPHQTRLAYAQYLSEAGLNTYIYCPKGDPILRKQWQQRWPEEQWRELVGLAATYAESGLHWGVGLSPFELYKHYGNAERQALRAKVVYLAEMGTSVLAILFDDMPGELPTLASRQAEIVSDVCRWGANMRIIVCPTYYSYDPILERYFGQRPAHYWSQLGAELPAEVDIFWTGNQVCSESIESDHISSINELLGRSVILWDNYPVNDGAERSNFLYTASLPARSTALRSVTRGHLCNPMNQGLLSLPALSGLAELYGRGRFDDATLSRFLGSQAWAQLSQDRGLFQQCGLSGLGERSCSELAAIYANLPGAAAREVTGWLRGEYRFDPQCLTG